MGYVGVDCDMTASANHVLGAFVQDSTSICAVGNFSENVVFCHYAFDVLWYVHFIRSVSKVKLHLGLQWCVPSLASLTVWTNSLSCRCHRARAVL